MAGRRGGALFNSSFYSFPAAVTFYALTLLSLMKTYSESSVQFSLCNSVRFSRVTVNCLLNVRRCVRPGDAQMNEAQSLPLSSELGLNRLG